ncbi:MAG: cyclopropane-fatty-acyl-phospholipid synthase family protein [Roseitalea porphyridii]|uniref:cyclopropane-fatty-acyl-phospholipid synthase family protein n=1 Tax=Roseitalea porphyridii TaxID=1852022 RepID=UPI0032EDDF5B
MGFYGRQLDRFLGRNIRSAHLRVRFPDGHTREYGSPSGPALAVRLTDERWIGRILRNPDLKFGEAYMEGALVPEDAGIYPLLDQLWRDLYGTGERPVAGTSPMRRLRRALKRAHPPARARRNVAHHYDLGNDLYRLFLDENMQYSCAYFAEPGMSLDEAQAAKMRHIARKLFIEPGQRVLDIGSGWGGLAVDLARHADAEVFGVTLSTEQFASARERAAEAGLGDRARFELTDYRSLDETFDRIVSVGMLEHVGINGYGEFFAQVRRLLAEHGVALIHTIGRTGPPATTNPFIDKYIFPGGYIPALSELVPHIEAQGLYLLDAEILRLHYADTLRAWRERFLANADRAAALHDERFVRMWDFYLASSELSFRYGEHVVFQLQLARRQDAVPVVRDYLYSHDRRTDFAAGAPPKRRPMRAKSAHAHTKKGAKPAPRRSGSGKASA